MRYTITRQSQWPGGLPVVEISEGGIDYTNPDALFPKYPGEFEEFNDPVKAVNVAIEICRSWRKDNQHKAKIGIGATGGMTMPFEPTSFKAAREWAVNRKDNIEKGG